jgi:hypothetical protein
MDEYVHLLSNLKDFNNNSKIVISSKTNDLDLLKYYISIQTPINNKINSLLENIIDVKKLETENKSLFSLDETNFVKEINSRNFKKKINEILTEYQKDQKKALFLSCKVYLIEKYFKNKSVFPSMHKM